MVKRVPGNPIIVQVGRLQLFGTLADTETAKAIYAALPIRSRANRWGDEVFFDIPVHRGHDKTATMQVKRGDIGYWPPGQALAIFFGPTPASPGDEPVPASEVNLVGFLEDAEKLKTVLDGEPIEMRKG